MKNFVEINRTPLGVKKNDFKSIVQTKARWLLTFCALLTLGVGQIWAYTSRQAKSGTITSVYVAGSMNGWSTSDSKFQLAKVNGDANHWAGAIYVKGQTSFYEFKLQLYCSNSTYNGMYSTGYNYHKDWTGGEAQIYSTDKGNATISPRNTSSSAYIKIDIDFYAEYGTDPNGYLSVTQTEVSALDASINATSSSVQGGSTSTITSSCTGGSGDYSYSYSVTDLSTSSSANSTLSSLSGTPVTFTAPYASTDKTYRITVTATETNTRLTSLEFSPTTSTATKDITVPGITAPTVTMTVDKVNVNQITLTGTITAYNGYGSNASDLSEVGFYIGATKYIATYKSGSTFTKTITGLSANTAHANVKAFATNPLATGNSGTQTVTTLADANYTVKVRVAHGSEAPIVYAWTDADSYGGSKMENGTYGSQDASEDKFEATTYDWYTYELNNKYENFLIYRTGDSDKSGDFPATRVSDCYWYNPSSSPRAKQMTCPEFEPQIVIHDGSTETMYEMTGDYTTVTKSQSLTAGTYYIKVMYNTEYYGKGSDYSNTIARTGSTTSNAISSMVVDGGYINLTADLAGTYTFSFNTSTKTLSVTYPEAYQVTFSKSIVGSDNSTISEPTASYSSGAVTVTSATTWIPTGTTVNFSAPDATNGYTWKGWYSVEDPSASWSSNRLATTAAYSPTINSSAVKTIYAVYDEDDYTVTVNASPTTGGSITTPSGSGSTVTAHVSTTAAIVASLENVAWHFAGWTTESGSASFGSSSSLSTTVNATGTSTVQANFVPRYGLIGSLSDDSGNDGMPGWTEGSAADFTVEDFDDVDKTDGVDLECSRTLLPNRQYKFMVYDRALGVRRGATSSTAFMKGTDNWELNAVSPSTVYHVAFKTKGYGNYIFHITKMGASDTYFPSIQIDTVESYKITYGQLTSYNDGESSDASTTGGSVNCKTTESAVDYTIASGEFIRTNGTAIFTATPASGYSFAGWYSDAACTSAYDDADTDVDIDDEAKTLTLSNIVANTKVYAKFTENMHELKLANDGHGHVEISSTEQSTVNVGVVTTATVTAVPDEGYHFLSWSVDDGVTVTSGSGTATITVRTTSNDKQVQATFEADKKIYFDNTYTKWENVWVYLFSQDVWYSEMANEGVHPSWAGRVVTYAQMTKVAGEDNLYEYSYYNSTHNYSFSHVAFAEYDQHSQTAFYNMHCAYRSDWHANLPVYVATSGYDLRNVNTKYHSGGYWRAYNPKAGESVHYYLDKSSGTATWPSGDQWFRASGDGSLVAEIQARLTDANTTYVFGVHSDAGGSNDQHYAEGTTITNDNSDSYFKLYKYNSDWNISVKTSTEGIYTFVLSMEYDSLRFSVIYPASVGDYRLTYSYVVDEVTRTRSSDVMKKVKTDVGAIHTSMYVDPSDESSQLIVQRCCSITDGVPQWENRKIFNHTYLADNFKQNSVATKGVYEMDLTVSGSTGDASTLSNISVYNGPFYIKTDCAKGGWADYTKNAMELNSINFDKGKPSTFDYYFCKWVNEARQKYGTNSWDACTLFSNAGTPTNVKCVIANDYNNSITDTLKSDDIIKNGATLYETLPIPGSVRFSYNSYTNELKRTYLYGSTCGGNGFLQLEANQTIWKSDNSSIADNKINFADDNNWLYILNIKATEGTRIRLTANYSTSTQYLKGATGSPLTDENTELLIGGSTSQVHPLQLIYDFKTNKLLSAWVAESGLNSSLAIYADIIIKRQHQAAAQQISFRENGELTNVNTVYGVMEFKKDTLNDGDKSPYWRDLYWISFPFNVKLSDVFGFGTYGTHWIIEYYDGKGRAQNGFWADSPSNWKFVTPTERERGYILKANEGYILALDLDELGATSTVWDNSATNAYLYFPSNTAIGSIVEEDEKVVNIDQDGYKCTINRGTSEGDRRIKDSYWHCIGVPSYAEVSHSISHTGTPDPNPEDVSQGSWTTSLPFLYSWNPERNTLSVKTGSDPLSFTFKPMHSYLVQYSAGTLTWNYVNKAPASVAARIMETPDMTYNLSLLCDEDEQDHTYVRLTDDAAVTNRFEFNQDLSKEYNAGRGNIWTVTADTVEVAGNSMPKPLQTTLVPVGVKVVANGEYTLAMPEGTNGENVVLIDNAYGTRTNLGLMPYTVTLTAGTYEGRFVLEFAPIQDSPTSLENDANANANANADVRKVFVGGRLYIIRDGKVYDAAGQRVE